VLGKACPHPGRKRLEQILETKGERIKIEQTSQFKFNTYIHGNATMKLPNSCLIQTKMSFLQKWRTGRSNRLCMGVGTSGRGEDIRKGCRRMNMVEYYVLMRENGKMRPVETIPEIGGGCIKDNDGGGEFNYDIL
jgi:hypothetical protein